MNISLEEQIEYMRGELHIFVGDKNELEIDTCKAILATLEAVRDISKAPEQAAKDLLEGINKGLTGEKLLQFAQRPRGGGS
jgi:hypothetical protein